MSHARIDDDVPMHDWPSGKLEQFVHESGRQGSVESLKLMRDKAIQLLEERGRTVMIDAPGATAFIEPKS